MIKCVIFDCDGTLVDSEYLCSLGFELLLKNYGVHANANEMVDEFRGKKLDLILRSLESKYKIKLADDFVISYREQVSNLFETDLRAFDGVREALSSIDLAMCVASSGPREKILRSLRLTDLEKYFSGNIYSAYDINSWKPEPDLFIHAANEMGFKASECAVVEDSVVGIRAAKSANMKAILFDPTKQGSLDSSVTCIHNMCDLKNILVRT